jgi:hypothetical protein
MEQARKTRQSQQDNRQSPFPASVDQQRVRIRSISRLHPILRPLNGRRSVRQGIGIQLSYRQLFLETSTIWIASWPKSYFFHSYLRTTISPRCRFIACDWKDQWIELFRRKLRNLTDNAPSCSYGRIRGGACPRWPGPAIPESWMISCEIANTDLQIPTCSRNWISGYTIVIE